MKQFDIVCLGELLVDFTPFGRSPAGMLLFEQNAGGATANVAVSLSRLGRPAAFIGKIGCDMNGKFLRRTLDEAGVNTSGLLSDPSKHTSMAFVTLSPEGERDFSFVRDADTQLRADELDSVMVERSRIFHFGSLSMTHEPSREATLCALRLAREAGLIISYDPNYRAPLWPDSQTAVRQISTVLPYVDILKVSDEEVFLLTGETDIKAGGRKLLLGGPSCVAVTQGSGGATVCLPSGCIHTPTHPGPVVDTTGAGDAFMGGFLSGLLDRGLHPRSIKPDDAKEISLFAHAVATRCVAARGGIPAMPSREEALAVCNGVGQ